MKIVTVVGARPQFVKAAVVSKALTEHGGFDEVLVHTGQHFDANMSDVFFEQLLIPRPSYLLDINGGQHGEMTGRMLAEIEKVLLAERPERVLVYGDTNSTLAAALAAAKLNIPVGHVEAGLRSFNMRMPEEINRILTDQISDMLFCPTDVAMRNLDQEGFGRRPVLVSKVGDVMQDSAQLFAKRARKPVELGVPDAKPFILATLHRAENTNDKARLSAIVDALHEIDATVAPVILPLHPRTRAAIAGLNKPFELKTIDPVGYFEMLWLLKHCGLVLSDSGGVQKEAFFFGKFCVTMRDETEWVELVKAGVNQLVGASSDLIIETVKARFNQPVADDPSMYGGGAAARRIAEHLAAGPSGSKL